MKTKLMALAALQYARRFMRPTECDIEYIDKQIAAIKAVIETPAEPVQWQVCRGGDWEWCKDDEVAFYKSCNLDVRPLYTTPQEPAAAGWMPIETAPKDRTPIDIWRSSNGGERCAEMRRVDIGGGNVFYEPVNSGYSCVRDTTHWMPLPAAPGCAA